MYENIEIQVEGKTVWLATEGSSGCKYNFNTKEELKQIIADYIADIVDYDLED